MTTFTTVSSVKLQTPPLPQTAVASSSENIAQSVDQRAQEAAHLVLKSSSTKASVHEEMTALSCGAFCFPGDESDDDNNRLPW
jgi:hypothetical protein